MAPLATLNVVGELPNEVALATSVTAIDAVPTVIVVLPVLASVIEQDAVPLAVLGLNETTAGLVLPGVGVTVQAVPLPVTMHPLDAESVPARLTRVSPIAWPLTQAPFGMRLNVPAIPLAVVNVVGAAVKADAGEGGVGEAAAVA